jgi:hypothetical protein
MSEQVTVYVVDDEPVIASTLAAIRSCEGRLTGLDRATVVNDRCWPTGKMAGRQLNIDNLHPTTPMEQTLTQGDNRTDIERLSAEHSLLTKRQYEALQKSPYLKMSTQEAESYDRRRSRIAEICDILSRLRAK